MKVIHGSWGFDIDSAKWVVAGVVIFIAILLRGASTYVVQAGDRAISVTAQQSVTLTAWRMNE